MPPTTNKILESLKIGSITAAGKEVALKVALKTTKWERPSNIARRQEPGFKAAISNSLKDLPEDTAEIIGREPEHPSEGDPVKHFTVVCRDKFGEFIKTLHLYATKKK